MKLISCYIDNFGMLSASHYSFRDGLNSVLSKNGTGKSTLVGFIKAMLYGIGETRKVDIAENDRKKYAPWQGGRFGGSLTFSVADKTYTIERSFGTKASLDEFRLIDTKSGAVSTDFTENLGEELFGIDRDGFERTVLFSEKNLLGKNDNKSISGKLSDLVGTEFDIGEYDKAMAMLEEKRKFYFKRGGGGEIGTLKKDLSVVQGTLDSLSDLSAKSTAEVAEIHSLEGEIRTLEEKSEKIRHNVERIGIIKENLAKEAVYQDMLSTLKTEEERLLNVKAFFKTEIPSQRELDDITKKKAQLEATLGKREFISSSEYIALGSFFRYPTSFEEIDSVLDLSSATDRLEEEKGRFEEGFDEYSEKAKTLFKKRLPTQDNLIKLRELANEKTKTINKTTAIICALMFALGIVFGLVVSYFAFALSAVALLVFLLAGRVQKPNTALTDALTAIDDSLVNMHPNDAIDEVERRINEYASLEKQRQDKVNALSAKIRENQTVIRAFLAKFPSTSSTPYTDTIKEIKDKYLKYYSMQMAREHIARNDCDSPYTTAELSAQINTFVAKFNVKTSNPLEEIQRALAEYTVQSQTVSKMRLQCEDYKARHSLVGKNAPTEDLSGEGDVTSLKKITDEIALRRENLQALLRKHEATMNEFARRDELTARENILKEQLDAYERELATVQNTMHYLKCACDSITDRYLGKTVEGFKKYQKEISGVDGEFSLDTEFSLSKTEGSQTHPESSYSRGTRDLYALSIRLSLIDSLYEDELPFIILDDPFIAFDDEKVQRAKAVLKKLASKRQIIYLTCAQSRAI